MPGGEVLVDDLVLAEVLRGVRSDREFERNARALTAFEQIAVCDPDLAIEATRNYRTLRAG